MKNYNEVQIVSVLNRHKSVDVKNKTIFVTGFVGIRTWGKIDYLTNKCGYVTSQKEK